MVNQQIRFATTPDGVRLAYAVHGTGPPLVKVANWLSHIDFDWQSPVWRHWLTELGRDHTVIRYDARGSGLSDRDVGDLTFDTRVRDLETVVDAVGLDRFALFGMSQGGAVGRATRTASGLNSGPLVPYLDPYESCLMRLMRLMRLLDVLGERG